MPGLRDRIAGLPDSPATGGVGIAVVALTTVWLGPWVLVVALALLLTRPVRYALWTLLTRRVVLGLVLGALLVAGFLYVVPPGLLPIPTGPGVLVAGPAYVGSAAEPRPVATSSGGAADASPDPGPLGAGVEVRSGWYGATGCHDLASAGSAAVAAICGDRLVVAEPSDLGRRNAVELPAGACAPRLRASADGIVLTGPDRAVRTYAISGKRTALLDLRPALPPGDCVVAATQDASGRWWFVSHRGTVGTVGSAGRFAVARLSRDEQVVAPLSVAGSSAYVVGDRALHRFTLAGGRLRKDWSADQDHVAGPSVTAPALVGNGTVAIVDGAEPSPRLTTYDVRSGRRTCAVRAFRGDPAEAVLVVAGDSVVVGRGREHRWLGRSGGSLTRIDTGTCRARWTRDAGLVGSAAQASLATGLLYAVTKRASRTGVDTWYLTGLDVRTGVVQFARRLGTGPWLTPGTRSLALAPDGAAYVGVRGGLLRVRDRPVTHS